MSAVLSVFSNIVSVFISALMFTLLLRAIFSLIAPDSDHPVINVIFNITDVLMAPARVLLNKTGWFQNSPFDMAYFFTFLFLWLIEAIFLLLS